jgi:hypothetical protein
MTMDTTATIETYVLAWNATEASNRKTLLEKSFSNNGSYLDEHVPKPISNLEEMNEMITFFRSRLNHQLVVIDAIDFHNNVFRFKWKLENDQGILSNGTFTGEFDSDNKIKKVVGFLDKK